MRVWERLSFRRRREREMEAELQFHLEEHVRDLVASGMDAAEARRRARIELGGLDVTKEACRDVRAGRLLEDLGQDVAYAVRTLRRSPGFTAATVLTLALGIGATTAIYSLLAALFLAPLPVHEPERLVRIDEEPWQNGFSWPEFVAYREQAAALFSSLGAFENDSQEVYANNGRETFLVEVVAVGGDYFPTLGLKPAVGRLFAPGPDDADGAAPFAVLSHALWTRRFGGQADAVGRTLILNQRPFTIVGVAPRGFRGLDFRAQPDIFVPVPMTMGLNRWTPADAPLRPTLNSGHSFLDLVGRLREGVTRGEAEAALKVIAGRLKEHDAREVSGSVVVSPADQRVVYHSQRDGLRRFAALLFAVAASCLLIAVANVAGLLLARAAERRKEIGLRLALGATPLRVIRQLATEGTLLAVAAAGAGVGVAVAMFSGLAGFRLPGHILVGSLDLGLDARVLGGAIAGAVLAALVFSMVPAWQTRRVDVRTAMAARGTGSRTPTRARELLLAAQVALCLPLLLGAALLLRTLHNRINVDVGFDPRGLLTVEFPGTPPRQAAERLATLADRTRHRHGVEAVEKETGGFLQRYVFIDGTQRDIPGTADFYVVGPDYFRLIGLPIRHGRGFGARDLEGAPKVAVVSESFARALWPKGNILGRRFGSGRLSLSDRKAATDTIEIVGVVRDARYARVHATGSVYVPLAQYQASERFAPDTLLIRAKDEAALIPALTAEASALDPALPPPRVERWIERIRGRLLTQRMGAFLLTLFGASALVISAVGLYGLLAYLVAQRTAEIGVRLAIGASRGDIVRLVLRRTTFVLSAGLAAGIAISLWSARLLEGFLFGVPPRDPVTLLAAALVLSSVGLFAAYLPARRASRIDPAEALRAD